MVMHTKILQVFNIAYCHLHSTRDIASTKKVCEGFIEAVKSQDPNLLNRPKFHLLLHLPQSMADFGRTASFNSER